MNGTLLVAEDHHSARELIAYALEGEGYNLVFAESGTEASNVASANHPDAALLDVSLPGLSGAEVCRQIKLQRHATPVILMSGALGRRELADQTISAGADAFLGKPFSLDELRTVLRAFMRIHEQSLEIERLGAAFTRAQDEIAKRGSGHAPSELDWSLSYHPFMKLARRRYFEHALEIAGGNKSKLARDSGLDRSTLYVHLRKLGMLMPKG